MKTNSSPDICVYANDVKMVEKRWNPRSPKYRSIQKKIKIGTTARNLVERSKDRKIPQKSKS